MKLYIAYVLASLLIAAPLVANHDDDKTVHVQKEVTQQDEEIVSAPTYKKIAQTLWKHRGKVAIGASVVVLAAIAYWYRDSLCMLFVGENAADIKEAIPTNQANVQEIKTTDLKNITGEPEKIVVVQKDAPVMPAQENVQAVQTETQQPSVERNILQVVAKEMDEVLKSGDETKIIALADKIAGLTVPNEGAVPMLVVETSDKGIVVLPVLPSTEEFAAAALELTPVTPTSVPEATPTVPVQEPSQVQDTLSEAPVATEPALPDTNNPQDFWDWFWANFGPKKAETLSVTEIAEPSDIPSTSSENQTVFGDQQN